MNMKKNLAFLLLFAAGVARAAVPAPPTTDFTRGFLVTTNQATAQTYLGVSAGGGGGSGLSTHVTTLGWSSTNLTGFNCATNGESFYVLATNNFHFGTSTFTNLPAKTVYQSYTLCVQMDTTGGWIGSMTNTIVGWSLATPVFIETNANAVSYVYFHTDLSTNATLVGTGNIDVRR